MNDFVRDSKVAELTNKVGLTSRPYKVKKKYLAERGFDPRTFGLCAKHASTPPLCYWQITTHSKLKIWPTLLLDERQFTMMYQFFLITQVILAFWLVLAYDLLEDRRTIDVIITKFFPLPFLNGGKFWELG